ncbi:ATP synthase F1 subunit gamma [Candidatus Microgenomates bacterium]|nr:ATP synthase F1 subunit gamma [Candidatus Microgenomates bacterium]
MAANIRLLQRRRRTAKNIAQITRAMEMVAASKMRKAQEKTVAAKPYSDKLRLLSQNLIGRIEESKHPYLLPRQKGKTLVLLVSSDKGLCGGFNSSLLREFLRFVKEKSEVEVVTVGKKLKKAVLRTEALLIADFPFGSSVPLFESILPVVNLIKDGFIKGEYKKVAALFTQFVSLGVQKPVFTTILPVEKETEELSKTAVAISYKFEPNTSELLTALMPHYLEMSIYQILLESYASEQAARMLAMHQASENAKDVIWQLSLTYNKVRQERITNELLDIAGGAMGVSL